jgi:hypothetical protein
MNEINLLEKYISLSKDIELKKVQLNLENDNSKKVEIGDVIRGKMQELELIKKQLVEIKDKSYSYNAFKMLVNYFTEYISNLGGINKASNVVKAQNTIKENEFIESIKRTVSNIIYIWDYGYDIPSEIILTHNQVNSIEIKELSCFLQLELVKVQKLNPINYISLFEYFHEFKNRIINRFVNN